MDNNKREQMETLIKRLSTALSVVMLVICAVCVVSLSLCIDQVQNLMTQHKYYRGELENINAMMSEIQSLYESEYIGELPDKEELEDYALMGFTAGFGDEYGYYSSPEESESADNTRNEKVVSIGVEIVYESDNGFYVIQAYRNSPAAEAGIMKGDYIISANEVNFFDTDKDGMLEAIRGETGTDVTLGIKRGEEELEITATRGEAKSESVRGEVLEGNVAYIKISKFTEYTDEEFKEYMDEYLSDGIESFIFDLRSNTGGVAESVIDMLDYLLPSGLIAKFEFKDTTKNTEYTSDTKEVNADMVVLVNGASASASELFTKALQDYGKATIIGTTTYGKGTVLSTYNLSNGGTLTLSSAKYYTLSGDEIEDVGIEPDITVEIPDEQLRIIYKLSKDEDEQFKTAYKELTGNSWNE